MVGMQLVGIANNVATQLSPQVVACALSLTSLLTALIFGSAKLVAAVSPLFQRGSFLVADTLYIIEHSPHGEIDSKDPVSDDSIGNEAAFVQSEAVLFAKIIKELDEKRQPGDDEKGLRWLKEHRAKRRTAARRGLVTRLAKTATLNSGILSRCKDAIIARFSSQLPAADEEQSSNSKKSSDQSFQTMATKVAPPRNESDSSSSGLPGEESKIQQSVTDVLPSSDKDGAPGEVAAPQQKQHHALSPMHKQVAAVKAANKLRSKVNRGGATNLQAQKPSHGEKPESTVSPMHRRMGTVKAVIKLRLKARARHVKPSPVSELLLEDHECMLQSAKRSCFEALLRGDKINSVPVELISLTSNFTRPEKVGSWFGMSDVAGPREIEVFSWGEMLGGSLTHFENAPIQYHSDAFVNGGSTALSSITADEEGLKTVMLKSLPVLGRSAIDLWLRLPGSSPSSALRLVFDTSDLNFDSMGEGTIRFRKTDMKRRKVYNSKDFGWNYHERDAYHKDMPKGLWCKLKYRRFMPTMALPDQGTIVPEREQQHRPTFQRGVRTVRMALPTASGAPPRKPPLMAPLKAAKAPKRNRAAYSY